MTRRRLRAEAFALAIGGIGTIIFLAHLETRFVGPRLVKEANAIDIVTGTVRLTALCAATYTVAVAVGVILEGSPRASAARRVARSWTSSPLRRILFVVCGAVAVIALPVTMSPAVESTSLILDDPPAGDSIDPGLAGDETATFSIVSGPALPLASPARAVTPTIRSSD